MSATTVPLEIHITPQKNSCDFIRTKFPPTNFKVSAIPTAASKTSTMGHATSKTASSTLEPAAVATKPRSSYSMQKAQTIDQSEVSSWNSPSVPEQPQTNGRHETMKPDAKQITPSERLDQVRMSNLVTCIMNFALKHIIYSMLFGNEYLLNTAWK